LEQVLPGLVLHEAANLVHQLGHHIPPARLSDATSCVRNAATPCPHGRETQDERASAVPEVPIATPETPSNPHVQRRLASPCNGSPAAARAAAPRERSCTFVSVDSNFVSGVL